MKSEPLISVENALRLILSHAHAFPTELIPLNQGIQRVLRENWTTDRDLPPYDRVTMDGIAIQYELAHNQPSLPIAGIAAAGSPQKKLLDPTTCLEVMTGSILPAGCDTVIPYEHIHIDQGKAIIQEAFTKGQNIHNQGSDQPMGSLVVRAGTTLSPAEIGLGASIGKHTIQVAKLPKVLIISTGDELVPIEAEPLAHQIRRSNVYRMEATLRAMSIPVSTAHLQDDWEEILAKMKAWIAEYEVILLSGGVSKGKFDYLPEALEKLGVQKHFHRISQRPGKPFWFGTHPEGCTVFALPGNPVSSFMCTQIYVKAWFAKSTGQSPDYQPMARLAEDVHFKPNLTYFLEVKITCDDQGTNIATPCKGNGSGDLANLVLADAFIELPKGREIYQAGEVYPIYWYR